MGVLLDALAAKGVAVEETQAYSHFLGRSAATLSRYLDRTYGIKLDAEDQAAMRESLFERYRHELNALPGIEAVVDELTVPCCVASSSQPDRIRYSLAVTGLLDRFEPHIFSASEVANGKPAPDLFFHAARSMGAQPETCLVIEDSPAGIQAAKAAGMTVLAFTGGSHIARGGLQEAIEAQKPDLIFNDMAQLPALLASGLPMRVPAA